MILSGSKPLTKRPIARFMSSGEIISLIRQYGKVADLFHHVTFDYTFEFALLQLQVILPNLI